MKPRATLLTGDSLEVLRGLPDNYFHTCITSPPYFGLRDYGTGTWQGGDPACDHSPAKRGSRFSSPVSAKQASNAGSGTASARDCCCGARRIDQQIGLERTPAEFIARLVEVFREVRRVLRPDGTCWVNMGDSYNNFRASKGPGQAIHGRDKLNGKPAPDSGPRGWACAKEKDLLGMPWRLAFALRDDGWYLRSALPWVKRSCMPESCRDRPTSAIEYVFMLAKHPRYFWDAEAVRRTASYGGEQLGICRGTKRRAHAMGRAPSGNEIPGANSKIPGQRNFRNSDLFFASLAGPPLGLMLDENGDPLALDINPEPFREAHFAVFPTRLASTFIQAASSQHGCCSTCRTPYSRIVEKREPDLEWMTACGADSNSEYKGQSQKDYGEAGAQDASETKARILKGMCKKETVGWKQECNCQPSNPVPCSILDPFSGAGSTALAASRLGRDSTSIDLKAAYHDMAAARLSSPKSKCLNHKGERLGFVEIDISRG